jgi:hypothetical protein
MNSGSTNDSTNGEKGNNIFFYSLILIDDICAIEFNNGGPTVRQPIVKEEDKRTFESIMKRVNTSASTIDEDGANLKSEETKPITSSVVVNARNVRFLDKLMSKKCKKCNSIKPPHSHHCSICKRCIAHMDHHCPWVNNCVGFYT